MPYRFVYSKKVEVKTPQKTALLVTAAGEPHTYTLSAEEFGLAEGFDGRRQPQEVLDEFRRSWGIQLTQQQFREFLDGMVSSGLLVLVPEEEEAGEPVRRSYVREVLETTRGRSAVGAGGRSRSRALQAAGADIPVDAEWVEQETASGESGIPWDVLDGDGIPAAEEGPPFEPLAILVPLPARVLLPLGRLIAFPAASQLLAIAVVAMAAAAGVYLARSDPQTWMLDLVLGAGWQGAALALVAGMYTLNLVIQLGRLGAAYEVTRNVPRFGLAVFDRIVPKLHAQIERPSPALRTRASAAALLAVLLVFTAAAAVLYFPLGLSQAWQLYALGLLAAASLALALMLSPLTRREGYYLLAGFLHTPSLMEAALVTGFGTSGGAADADEPGFGRWPVIVYWWAALLYMLALAVGVYLALANWVAPWWSVLGVFVFLALVVVSMTRRLVAAQRVIPTGQSMVLRGIYGSGQRARPRLRSVLTLLAVAAGLSVLAVLPYNVQPGGQLLILPYERAEVRALVDGDVRAVHVQEGDLVAAGDLIATLANEGQTAMVTATESRLKALQARLAIAQTGPTKEEIALARQKVLTAETRVGFSRSRDERYTELDRKSMVSKQDYENARAEAEIDLQRLEEARRDLEVLLSWKRPEEIDEIEAQIAREQADLVYARKQLAETEARAVISGRIVSGTLQFAVGDYLEKGDAVATIENTETVQGEIAVPEAEIGDVVVGSPVRVKAWAYPNEQFSGVVVSIAPNAERGVTGKVVRVRTDIENPDGRLRSEMTGYGKITGPTKPVILAFTQSLIRFFTVELWSWIP